MNVLYSSTRTITMGEEDAIDVNYVRLNEVTDVAARNRVAKTPKLCSEKRRRKLYIWLCGVLTLIPVMLTIIGLLSLPTVFYALPTNNAVRSLLYIRS